MRFLAAVVATLSLVVSGHVLAHPGHSQVTEVEWNAETGRFEIGMKLDAVALEDSVSVWRQKRFRLESGEPVDEVLPDWLAERFRITSTPESREGAIRWVGHELELHVVWLFFEYRPAPESLKSGAMEPGMLTPERLRIENRCVLQVRPEAVHQIQFRHGTTVLTGHCSHGQPVAELQHDRFRSPFGQSSAQNQLIRPASADR